MKTKECNPSTNMRIKLHTSLLLTLLLVIMSTLNAGAQNTLKATRQINPQKEQPSKQDPVKIASETSNTGTEDVQKTKHPALPYLNYKGISDQELAKTEWIKDHQEEYNQMLQSAEKTDTKSEKVFENKTTIIHSDKTDDGSCPEFHQ